MSHVTTSCHIGLRRVLYEGVVSHMNKSCIIWVSRVQYEWVIYYIWKRFVTWDWGVLHIVAVWNVWTRYVPYWWGVSHMMGIYPVKVREGICTQCMGHVTSYCAMSYMNECPFVVWILSVCMYIDACIHACIRPCRHTCIWTNSHRKNNTYLHAFSSVTFPRILGTPTMSFQ